MSPNPHTSQQLIFELLHNARRFFPGGSRPQLNRAHLSAPYPTPDHNPAPDHPTMPGFRSASPLHQNSGYPALVVRVIPADSRGER